MTRIHIAAVLARQSHRFIAFAFALAACATGFDALASAAIWTEKCMSCHGSVPSGGERGNAADAPNVILNALTAVPQMAGIPLTQSERNSLATYIESVIDTTPMALPTSYDTTTTLNLGTKLAFGTAANWSAFVQDTAPTKGTVTYDTATPSVTYNPNACATGTDTFSFHLRNGPGGLLSSERTVNVTIANNPPIPVITSPATHSGTFGTPITAYTIASAAYPCPTTTFSHTGTLPPGVTRSGATISGTPSAVGSGTYTVTLSATNATGTDTQTLTFTIAKASQAISFPNIPSPRPFTTAPQSFSAATGGGSGFPIVYSSATPSVCSVSSSPRFYTMITAGTCTINANQDGNVNYEAAPEVSRSVVINPTAPGSPPTIGAATPGVESATISFTPPSNTGGQPLTFTASCTASGQATRTAVGTASPLTVTNMVAGVLYSCSVSVANAQGFGGTSAAATVTPNFADSNADADNDGVPNHVEASEGLDPNVKDNDIFANARLFAMQQYRDFLGREGDATGVQNWAGQITNGLQTRAEVVESFFDSAEFQNGLPQVSRLYFAFFNRIPDYPGLLFHTGRYRVGVPLNTIAQDFAGSQEFLVTYGSLDSGQYVDLVYQNVLGRPADPDGRANALAQLDGGAMTRGELMAAFSESQEHLNLSAPEVFVTAVYVGMLRRSPDPAGLQNWVGAFEAGAPRLTMLQAFLDAQEYRNRFLP